MRDSFSLRVGVNFDLDWLELLIPSNLLDAGANVVDACYLPGSFRRPSGAWPYQRG
jgi:hypothetical protein